MIFFTQKNFFYVNPKSLFEDVILIEEIKIENLNYYLK